MPRIRLKPLAQLCRRLAFATSGGLDDRRIWRDEATRGSRLQRVAVGVVSAELAAGRSIADALAKTGDYFPPLFRQLAAVGESTGQLDRTYRRLAEHYETTLTARRTLLGALAWPVIQLGIAVLTIGVVIWISATLNLKSLDGKPLDMFGLGLTGSRGLTIYLFLIITAAIGTLLAIEGARRGLFTTRALERLALKIPGLGVALQTLALARITWALQLVLDTPMDLRKALPLALDAAGNDAYRRVTGQVVRDIGAGVPLSLALANSQAFPGDFLEAVSVGEQSGMLAETMQRLSKQYQERAATAIGIIARIFGGVVWALVALMIIVLIFRVYGSYIGTINSLSQPGGGMGTP